MHTRIQRALIGSVCHFWQVLFVSYVGQANHTALDPWSVLLIRSCALGQACAIPDCTRCVPLSVPSTSFWYYVSLLTVLSVVGSAHVRLHFFVIWRGRCAFAVGSPVVDRIAEFLRLVCNRCFIAQKSVAVCVPYILNMWLPRLLQSVELLTVMSDFCAGKNKLTWTELSPQHVKQFCRPTTSLATCTY